MPQQEQWQLTDNAAVLYERYAVTYLLGPWAPGLVALAALQPGERVLDVACGTGVVTRLVAAQVGTTGQVTGLDLNAGMLAVARALPPPPGAAITWVEGNATAMHLADATFNVVVCQQGVQFFPDRPAALREMHRVLVPGGRLVLSVWGPMQQSPYFIALTDALARHVSADAARILGAPFGLADAEALHALLVEAGFREVDIQSRIMKQRLPPVERFVLAHLASAPAALSGAVVALSEATRTALVQDVSRALQSYADGEGVVVPQEAHIALART